MKNVGFIGWRGMVGSVLMQRMIEERDFDAIRPVFFSTSQHGEPAPTFTGQQGTLQDAYDIAAPAVIQLTSPGLTSCSEPKLSLCSNCPSNK